MDRRMLLAMVLAILVLFINTLVFAPKHKEVPPPPKTTEQVPEAPVKASEMRLQGRMPCNRSIPPGMGMILDQTAASDTTGAIRVETRSVIAEFDPVGGSLRSWKLLKYTDAAGHAADLVRTADIGALWFTLKDGTRQIRTDSTRFRPTVTRSGESHHDPFCGGGSVGHLGREGLHNSWQRDTCAGSN